MSHAQTLCLFHIRRFTAKHFLRYRHCHVIQGVKLFQFKMPLDIFRVQIEILQYWICYKKLQMFVKRNEIIQGITYDDDCLRWLVRNWRLPPWHLPVVAPQFACVLYTFVLVLHRVFCLECGVHLLVFVSFPYLAAELARPQTYHSRLHSTHSQGSHTWVTGLKDKFDHDLLLVVVADFPWEIPWNIRFPVIVYENKGRIKVKISQNKTGKNTHIKQIL